MGGRSRSRRERAINIHIHAWVLGSEGMWVFSYVGGYVGIWLRRRVCVCGLLDKRMRGYVCRYLSMLCGWVCGFVGRMQ